MIILPTLQKLPELQIHLLLDLALILVQYMRMVIILLSDIYLPYEELRLI